VPGRTLEERLDEGSLPPAEALRFVASVAEALAAAHSAGVVHGNLVPANVIDGPSGVKVTDFGLWTLRKHPPGERFHSVLSYAAPERLSGGPATPATDMYSLGVLFIACLSGIAAAGTAGPAPVTDPAADLVSPGLAALWAACLGASPRDRPSAAHVAFMSRQALAAQPAAARAEAAPGQHAGARAEGAPGQPAGRAGPDESTAGERAAPVAVGRWVPDGTPDRPDAGHGPGPGDRPGHRDRPGHPDRPGQGGPGGRTGRGSAAPRGRRFGRAGRTRGGMLALGAAGAGVAVAAVMLTQFLTSPAAQTTGTSATPSAHVTASRPAVASRPTAHPLPSADATSSVLASASPPPLQVLGQIQATIRHGAASGQIRQDVAVDLENLIQPVQADLAAGNTAGVSALVSALKAKLATRLGEGAITRAADAELGRELSTLLNSVTGHG
jgi:serine/threonine-protein kinase